MQLALGLQKMDLAARLALVKTVAHKWYTTMCRRRHRNRRGIDSTEAPEQVWLELDRDARLDAEAVKSEPPAKFKKWTGWDEAFEKAKARTANNAGIDRCAMEFVVAQRLLHDDPNLFPGRHCDIRYSAQQLGLCLSIPEVRQILGEKEKRKRHNASNEDRQAKKRRVALKKRK
eukprot:Hpha_TRINITY_DN4310_c0_g1::TRINITY_DN4310_c0_g1_i1::g.50109::m.50109